MSPKPPPGPDNALRSAPESPEELRFACNVPTSLLFFFFPSSLHRVLKPPFCILFLLLKCPHSLSPFFLASFSQKILSLLCSRSCWLFFRFPLSLLSLLFFSFSVSVFLPDFYCLPIPCPALPGRVDVPPPLFADTREEFLVLSCASRCWLHPGQPRCFAECKGNPAAPGGGGTGLGRCPGPHEGVQTPGSSPRVQKCLSLSTGCGQSSFWELGTDVKKADL